MRFYEVSFFACDDDEAPPEATLLHYSKGNFAPVTLRIGTESPIENGITIHMDDRAFIAFKNSVLAAHKQWEKEREG